VSQVNAFVAAGAGFLAAVLWFDLMFDVQVARHREGVVPEAVLSSIAAYYARVTTSARPMNRLIATVMLVTLAAIVVEIARGHPARWIGVASLALAVPAIALAGARIVPSAVRLGERADTPEQQSSLARSIFAGHVLCLTLIVGVLIVQLGFG
jgi:ER membrane protein SH3